MVATYGRILAAACALATTASAVTPVIVKGKDFVNSETGDRFQILGVDYQPGGTNAVNGKSDPLTDKEACLRDAALMQQLGVNTIRIYNLAPDLNHDECVSIFNAAGIYMILDVNSPLYPGYIDRTAPWTTYTKDYYTQVFGIIEAFKDYPNTLAFFAGNEVINEDSVEQVPQYIRAVQRDMKEYISNHLDRSIPVGYSAADVRPILEDTLNYFMCEDEDYPNSHSDFFGLNSYSWCGDASYKSSGYDKLTEMMSDATIPVFFSEYGCNEVQPREFTEVQAIYGEEMTATFSGGLVYEYTQEDNDYGLVKVNDNDTLTLLVDFDNLQTQYAKLDMDRISSSNATQTSVKSIKCSADLIQNGTFSSNFTLPAKPPGVQKLIDDGYTKVDAGKIVDVESQEVSTTIYDHNGQKITGLKLNVLADGQSNQPGNSTIGSSSNSSGSSSSASASGSDGDSDSGDGGNAAGTVAVPVGLATVAATIFGLVML
ncbi:1,3-beta-glucanosyltransferase gel2 [Aspergillus mulundensis]|uniref:1,3-beta-glucanosyltransferase n=1 Tax=Aspergillus mulundensis TaxID=1810919 RepID=A0A3D8R934_9EURO|nr:1,3-beta-glucanosyltransferase [Aspergillus mulundensis]RDW70496.1 1,3-beta-glucanosyltransferase [Aspergillus mulundensis]